MYWTVHYPCSLHVITIGPTKHDITSAIGRLPIKAGKFDTSRSVIFWTTKRKDENLYYHPVNRLCLCIGQRTLNE